MLAGFFKCIAAPLGAVLCIAHAEPKLIVTNSIRLQTFGHGVRDAQCQNVCPQLEYICKVIAELLVKTA